MPRLDTLRSDFHVLRSMLRGMPRASTQAEQLAAFYAPQAAHYDRFRERLLQGREQMIAKLPLVDDAHVIDLGGGTVCRIGRGTGVTGIRCATGECSAEEDSETKSREK